MQSKFRISGVIPVLVPAHFMHEDSCHRAPALGYGAYNKAISAQNLHRKQICNCACLLFHDDSIGFFLHHSFPVHSRVIFVGTDPAISPVDHDTCSLNNMIHISRHIIDTLSVQVDDPQRTWPLKAAAATSTLCGKDGPRSQPFRQRLGQIISKLHASITVQTDEDVIGSLERAVRVSRLDRSDHLCEQCSVLCRISLCLAKPRQGIHRNDMESGISTLDARPI